MVWRNLEVGLYACLQLCEYILIKIWPITGDANRALKSGGLYLNGNKVAEAQRTLVGEDLVGGKFVVLGMGKVERKILFLRS